MDIIITIAPVIAMFLYVYHADKPYREADIIAKHNRKHGIPNTGAHGAHDRLMDGTSENFGDDINTLMRGF